MKRTLLTLAILAIVMVGIAGSPAPVFAQTPNCSLPGTTGNTGTLVNGTCTPLPAGNPADSGGASWVSNFNLAEAVFGGMARGMGQLLMTISGGILALVGVFYDWVIEYTILNMAQNIGNPSGIGGSITKAWATLRDVANMAFIFVLLYAALRAMFSTEFGGIGKTIKDIIIVALLINFSLFFSKVVIDASNIVSVGFYNSIINAGVSSVGGGAPASPPTISSGYARMVGLQSWHDPVLLTKKEIGDPKTIMQVAIMSSIFFLVTAVIFLISAIMFVVRFILLIFIMILSPLALIAYIIPGQKKNFDTWKSALIDQSFFAPIFFALTWVSLKIASTPGFLGQLGGGISAGGTIANPKYVQLVTDSPSTAMALVLNYVIVMGFAVAALILSKKMASSTSGFKTISGGVGAAALGGTALAARNTVGRASSWISETQREKWSQSAAGRAGLWLANKGGKASYDVRGLADTKAGKAVGASEALGIAGKAGGKGGFVDATKKKAEAKAKYAKEVYGQTADEKENEEKLKKEYEGYVDKDGKFVKGHKQIYDDAKKAEEETIKENRKIETEKSKKIKEEAEQNVKEKEEKLRNSSGNIRDYTEAKKELEDAKLKSQRAAEAHKLSLEREKAKIEDADYSQATRDLKSTADAHQRAWKEAKDIGVKRQQEYAERVKTGSPVSTGAGAMVGGVVGGAFGPLGAAAGAGAGAWLGNKLGSKLPEWANWAGNKAAARKIKAEAGGKSNKEKAADLLKAMKEEEDKASGTPDATPPTNPPPNP